MLEIDKPYTKLRRLPRNITTEQIGSGDSETRWEEALLESVNLLNEVRMFSYSNARHVNHLSFEVEYNVTHLGKPHCKGNTLY